MAILEPLIDDEDIQGNILAGFNKPFQNFIAIKFNGTNEQTREWLLSLNVTSHKEIIDFRKQFRAFRNMDLLEGNEAPTSVWLNLAFTYHGLLKITKSAKDFKDFIFKGGMGTASARLKDPRDKKHPGHESNWLFGGKKNEPDALIILGADKKRQILEATENFLEKLSDFKISCLNVDNGNDIGVFGKNPTEIEKLRATEHFGFKDGMSQPGLRGRLKSNNELLTKREIPPPIDPISIAFAKHGQPLIYPGEFVLGYERQSDSSGQIAVAPYPLGKQQASVAPDWAKNGSFLVYRRLRQAVGPFSEFIKKKTNHFSDLGLRIDGKELASLLVGRWPNGAPIMEFPDQEPSEYLGTNEDFRYKDDEFSKLCPASAHIRKVNPRGLTTEQGAPQKTLVHRILRRGIPYGVPYIQGDDTDRGLLFVSYQSSIKEQFEFLQRNWANHDLNPHSLVGKSGHDLIIGQTKKKERNRFLKFLKNNETYEVNTNDESIKDWVIPTGGGYFFSPSISAIKLLATDKK